MAGDEAHSVAERLVIESGAELFDAHESEENMQDPYRAVDGSDAVIWLHSSSDVPLSMTDYNPLYADTVMQRALRIGRPVLYYYFVKEPDECPPAPALLIRVNRQHNVRNQEEFEAHLRTDLRDLISGEI